jgi:hypothetical protein
MPVSQSQYGPQQQGQRGRGRGIPQQPGQTGLASLNGAQAARLGQLFSGQNPQPQQQGMDVAPQASNGQQIPQDVLSRYNQANQPSQGPGGYGTQQQAPFQTQQMLNNVQQGTGALGQMGQQSPEQMAAIEAARTTYAPPPKTPQQQAEATPANLSQLYNQLNMAQGMGQGQQQGYPQQGQVGLGQYVGAGQQVYPQQSAMPKNYYAESGAPDQLSTGQSSNPSQLFGQFNQAQGMGQGQQQGTGAMGGSQTSGGFMSGTGGGTTGGGGMSRGKGFRSGGAVNNVRLSNDDVKRILNALATAREVVKNGK